MCPAGGSFCCRGVSLLPAQLYHFYKRKNQGLLPGISFLDCLGHLAGFCWCWALARHAGQQGQRVPSMERVYPCCPCKSPTLPRATWHVPLEPTTSGIQQNVPGSLCNLCQAAGPDHSSSGASPARQGRRTTPHGVGLPPVLQASAQSGPKPEHGSLFPPLPLWVS